MSLTLLLLFHWSSLIGLFYFHTILTCCNTHLSRAHDLLSSIDGLLAAGTFLRTSKLLGKLGWVGVGGGSVALWPVKVESFRFNCTTLGLIFHFCCPSKFPPKPILNCFTDIFTFGVSLELRQNTTIWSHAGKIKPAILEYFCTKDHL